MKKFITISLISILTSVSYAKYQPYCAGTSDGTDTSSINTTLSSGVYGEVCGGNSANETYAAAGRCGEVNGDITLTLKDVTIHGWVIVGNTANKHFEGDVNYLNGVSGKITLNFEEGAVVTPDVLDDYLSETGIRGGLSGAYTKATVGAIEMNFNGGTVNESYVMAAGGNGSANIKGDVVINANGTNFSGTKYSSKMGITAIMGTQGCLDPTSTTYGYGASNAGDSISSYIGGRIEGALRINISAGTINGNIWGGYADSRIDGGTHVVVSGGTVNGDIHLGISGYNAYVGDSSITIKGDAVINGDLYGKMDSAENWDPSYTLERIMKSATLKIGDGQDGYVGTITSAIYDFDTIIISSTSKVVFEKAFNVEKLIVEMSEIMTLAEGNAQVSLADGTTFDVLTIKLAATLEEGVSTSLDLSSVFGENTSVVLSSMEGKTLTFIDSNNQEWSTADFSATDSTLSFTIGTAVPEPAEWAMILGALALGWAIYRRK